MSGVGDARFSQFEHGPNQSLTSGMVDDNSALNDLQRELQGTHEVIKTLGRGACGRVILARDVRLPTRPLVAIKLIERGNFVSSYNVYVAREILHHGSLRHPFVVSLFEVFLTRRFVAIVMEFAEGGDLFHYVNAQHQKRLTEEMARYFFQQLVVGLQYIHGRGVANRDLKLENLLLSKVPTPGGTSAMLKMCDFGYSKHEFNSSARTHVGTPVYMSPEIIMGGNRYDAKMTDIWSAGVVLYIMLTGQYPFDRRAADYASRVMQGAWSPFPPHLGISLEVQDLVGRMLQALPARRATLDEIMRHPWFQRDLPPSVMDLNAAFWAQAPDPTSSPLAEAAKTVEAIVMRGKKVGELEEERLSCTFPAIQDLYEAAAAAAGGRGGLIEPSGPTSAYVSVNTLLSTRLVQHI